MPKLIITNLSQKTHMMAQAGETNSDIRRRTTRSPLKERRMGQRRSNLGCDKVNEEFATSNYIQSRHFHTIFLSDAFLISWQERQ